MPKDQQQQQQQVAIHWYQNGLRFHDNPALKDACDKSSHLIPLYIIDPESPFAQTRGRKAGCIRANFVLESIQEIDQELRKMNSQLIVIRGKPEVVLPEVIAATCANALFYEKAAAAPIREAHATVLKAITDRQSRDDKTSNSICIIKGYETHNLHSMEHYLAKCKGGTAPMSYGGFTKIFQSMTVPKEVETVTNVPPLPADTYQTLETLFPGSMGIPTLEQIGYTNVKEQLKNRKNGGIDFDGGEKAALALLDVMKSRPQWVATFEKPKTSPNAMAVDTTGLSPYVKHGCLSPRTFFHELGKIYAKYNPKNCSKPPVSLHGQLMWREYNYLMAYSTPNFDQMIGNQMARQIPWDDDPHLVSIWKDSQTGYPFIDAIMTQLRETGWIHHLARHAVACFLTRGDLWQSWEQGAKVFEEYLIDADFCINNFNWQWLSCTAHFYQYFRCYSPIAFGKKTDPNGDYIRKWLPQFKDMPKKVRSSVVLVAGCCVVHLLESMCTYAQHLMTC